MINFNTFLNESGIATHSRVFGNRKTVPTKWTAEFVFEDYVSEDAIKDAIKSAGITDEYFISKTQRMIIVGFHNAEKMKPAQVKQIQLMRGIISAKRFKV